MLIPQKRKLHKKHLEVISSYEVKPIKIGWLEYTINVGQTGYYQMNFRYASNNTVGGPFFLEVDGMKISPDMTVTSTGGWDQWTSKTYENIIKEIDKIKLELKSYDEMLIKKNKWIVINKIDLLTNDQILKLKESFQKHRSDVYFISTIDKTGIKELTKNIYEFLKYENRTKEI